jgi:hypothetical protein
MDDKGSTLNADPPSALKNDLHVPRQELERKFQIVLLGRKCSDGAEKHCKGKLTLTLISSQSENLITSNYAKFRRNPIIIEGCSSSQRSFHVVRRKSEQKSQGRFTVLRTASEQLNHYSTHPLTLGAWPFCRTASCSSRNELALSP